MGLKFVLYHAQHKAVVHVLHNAVDDVGQFAFFVKFPQEIEIYFNFLGRYIPPSLQPVPLTPEEQKELRKKEERKDRLHQNYLKRKASGAQKRYEDKIKAKKKAEMDAKKALILAEDMKKGIFSTVNQLPKEEPRKGSIAASAAV